MAHLGIEGAPWYRRRASHIHPWYCIERLRQTCRPNTHLATLLTGRPNTYLATLLTGRPNTHLATQQTGRPNTYLATQKTGRPNTHLATQQTGRPNTHLATQQTGRQNTNLATRICCQCPNFDKLSITQMLHIEEKKAQELFIQTY